VPDAIDRLHPAVTHHLVNSLGWRSLRPLQAAAVGPLMDGEHALLGAPTAAGKTEAAVFPVLSRMTEERWSGLSVLYVCPLRALLNNLTPRISGYCELLGRKAAVWHGDVGPSERARIQRDPPDLLLTTPESLEAMMLSRRVDDEGLLGSVRVVVVDEIHAFAADDRGWHLLALLARLDARLERPAQRIGLTATVGNPDELLRWFCSGAGGARRVVMPGGGPMTAPAFEVDWVGNVENAATVIAGVHRGEKRLVFADSRAQVEQVAAHLRGLGITTFVSHSSLSADERRQAERAFTESRDCVIVATSTLELGIDVGDLDRVIQIGAPRKVASVLQRIGRTGRRAGTVRNCLFLATTHEELVQAFALVSLVEQGWVEPLQPPPQPVHLVAQQLLATVLAEGRLGRSTWPGVLAAVFGAGGLDNDAARRVVETMKDRGIILDLSGVLQIGEEGERLFGRRHFMDVTSMFLTEPLLAVMWGQRLLGQIDPTALTKRDGGQPVVLLGGAAWAVGDVDWGRRIAWVEPSDEPGRSRWSGSGGALSVDICHAMREVVASMTVPRSATARGRAALSEIRDAFWFATDGATTMEPDRQRARTRWWTFAGGRANAELRRRLDHAGVRSASHDDLGITLIGQPLVADVVGAVSKASPVLELDIRRAEAVKFHEAVADSDLRGMLDARDADPDGVARCLREGIELAAS
jgi:ATP-dependent Lhr-like helicase